MKGVILAGGKGTRLRPITYTTQKQLVPLANKPVIQHVIEDLKSAGITDIGVVIGGQFPGDIKTFLGDGSDFGVDITYILQGESLGLAHAVGCAEPFVEDDPFVVYFGDTILGEDITTTLVDSFDPQTHDAGLVLQHVDDPTRFGIVDTEDGEITRILEKPEDPPTDLAYVGVLAFTSSVFQKIEDLEPSWRGELELTQALHELAIDDHTIEWNVSNGIWKDVGTPEDVISTNRILQEDLQSDIRGTILDEANISGPIQVGNGSTIEPSATLDGPTVIGSDTVVGSDAVVGPYTSIGDNCVIEGSHISSSVVMDNAEISGERIIENSIIAKDATLDSVEGSESNQYIIGRKSRIRD
jgi:glucose-1-phosphate thymidylyltransferase